MLDALLFDSHGSPRQLIRLPKAEAQEILRTQEGSAASNLFLLLPWLHLRQIRSGNRLLVFR
jgi:hypothetical protein